MTVIFIEEILAFTHPLRTPRTRLRTKNEPRMMRLTKYNHGQ